MALYFNSNNHILESLPGLMFTELILIKSNTFLRSYLRFGNTCSRFLLQLYDVLSSAKLQTSDFVMEQNKSFIKTLKKRRPRIDPCGTSGTVLGANSLTFFNFYLKYIYILITILHLTHKGRYTCDVHENCLIFRTPHPLSIYVQNFPTPLDLGRPILNDALPPPPSPTNYETTTAPCM